MNWLVIPHIGKKTIRGESNFLLHLDIARYMTSRGDYAHILVDAEAEDKDLPVIDRVFYMRLPPAPRGLSYYSRMAILPQQVIEECNRRRGTRMIDAVITSRPLVVCAVKTALSSVNVQFVPVIYVEPGAEDKLRRMGNDDFRRALAQGWTGADCCVLLTERERDVVLEQLRRFCSGSEVQRFLDRMFLNPVGVPIDTADKYRDVPKNDQFTLFFGARANDVKQVDEIARLYDLVYRSGRKVRMVFATPTAKLSATKYIGRSKFKENPDIELYCQLGRDEYMKLAAGAHVFVAMSKWEGFPVGFWEQMYLGLVGLFPRKPWALGQLPEEYPFWFSNVEEAYAKICWVMDNYEEARRQSAFMIELIREEYRKDVVWNRLRERALEVVGWKQFKMMSTIRPLVEDGAAALGNRFSIEELVTFTVEQSVALPEDSDKRGEDFKYPGNYDFYRHALELGFDYTLEDNGKRTVFFKEALDAEALGV